jgi:hypothetical protein
MPPHALRTQQLWDVGALEKSLPLNEKEPSVHDTRKARRSVSFRTTVHFREIAPLTEISEDEIRSVWYNDDEYVKIKAGVTATVKKSANGDSINEDEGYCMRGLEGRTKFGARRRKMSKARALDSVWKVQVSLWKKKTNNLEVIAAAYKPHSLHAKYPAIEAAHSDELFVKEHM